MFTLTQRVVGKKSLIGYQTHLQPIRNEFTIVWANFKYSETKDYFFSSVTIHMVFVFFSLKNRKVMAAARVIFDGTEGENEEFFRILIQIIE